MPLRKSSGKGEPLAWVWDEATQTTRASTGQMSGIIRNRNGKYIWSVSTGNVFDYNNELATGTERTSAEAMKKAGKVIQAGM